MNRKYIVGTVGDRGIRPLEAVVCVLLLIIITGTFGCGRALISQGDKPISVYDRVIQLGKIRCGYGVYPPHCIKDPNTGKLSGIGIEALELVAKKLGLKIEWVEEIVWGTMIEGLETNRYDMVATPIWPNAKRARRGDFSKSLFYSPVFAYVRYGDKRFSNRNLNQVNSPQYKIATLDGATAQLIANEDFPNAKQISLPEGVDLAQLLVTVSSGKADLTFSQPAEVSRFLAYNPRALATVVTKEPVRIYANCWLFKRGQCEFKNMIDTVLDEITNDGTLEKILRKYEPDHNSLYSVAPPYK